MRNISLFITNAILIIAMSFFLSCKGKRNDLSEKGKTKDSISEVVYDTSPSLKKDSFILKDELVKNKKDSGNTVAGEYLGMVTIDYMHLMLKTGADTLYFWLGENCNYDMLRPGDKIKVYWRKVQGYIPEAGGRIEKTEATKIEKLK